MRHHRPLFALIALAGALAALPHDAGAQAARRRTVDDWLADCRDRRHDDDDRVRVCEIRELGFRPAGAAIRADASPNGGVTVVGWDRDSVAVRALVSASARTEEAATALLREVHVTRTGTAVGADGPNTHGRESWWVHYEVRVPRRADVEAETENGPVWAEAVAGRLDLRTTNGPLTLVDVAGDVRARAQNGPLTVDLSGTRWEGAGLDAETHNGPATVTIPEGYSAQLETGTVNGPMWVDFPVTLQGRIGRMTRITTTLGSGGAPVRVLTTNGPLAVRRR